MEKFIENKLEAHFNADSDDRKKTFRHSINSLQTKFLIESHLIAY